jgi:hypothetical protein
MQFFVGQSMESGRSHHSGPQELGRDASIRCYVAPTFAFKFSRFVEVA